MPTLQKTQGNTAMSRLVRPQLTIDTRAHTKPNVDPFSTQSAPACTRQERGIPPIQYTVDRHCTKVSEMMNSPTWRSQRPGPEVVDDSTPAESLGPHDADNTNPLGPCFQDDREWHSVGEYENFNGAFPNLTRREPGQRRHADSAISLGRDAEAMRILGIHPFSKTPDSPADTFIISASVPHGAAYPDGAVYGELQPVLIPRKHPDIQSKTAEDDLSFELTSEDDYLGSHEAGFPSSPRSLSQSLGQLENRELPNEKDVSGKEKTKQDLERDIHQLMERDEAIKSVNFCQQACPRHDRRSDPEDKLRFRGLLGRLRCEAEALTDDCTDKITLHDPAIVSFAPKKSSQHSSNKKLDAQPHTEDKKFPAKGKHHTSSDSGYASPSAHLIPFTGAPSMSRHGTSDEFGSEPVTIPPGKVDSKNSEPGRSSNFSRLNPAAKAFSSANGHSVSPKKRGGVTPAPVNNCDFLSPSLAQAQFGTEIQSQCLGYNGLPKVSSPLTNWALERLGLLQLSSTLVPQISPFPQAVMPSPPGISMTANLPPGIQSPGTNLPLLPPPPGSGLPGGLANSPGFVSTPGPILSDIMGPFHQQLATIPSCNNPAHQGAPAFSATQGFPVPTVPQLPPPAPPASMLSPNHRAPVPLPMAPAVPTVNPILRKSVPKPKVPNTTGQQYWEYWHELRRTFEPGYAQKSKQNQQKRYMKQQIHRDGSTTNHV